MIQKHILVAGRLRRPPASGWSWVDRRFLREHGDYLSRDATLLYLFLATVADRHGLSFYSDPTLTSRLQLSPQTLQRARQELLDRDLIAHQLPLVQVLSLPAAAVSRRVEPGQGLIRLGELFQQRAADPGRKAP
jgi:Helix-turn-helix domain